MTATGKAVAVMAVFTGIAVWVLASVGVGEHFREPLWAAGTALALWTILVANVGIFFKMVGMEPWKWVKNEHQV